VNHSGPDRHDPNTHSSSRAHATERAQGATSFHPSGDWLRTVLKNTSDVICVLKADGSFRYISPAVERVFGYPPEALLGTVCFDYVHTDDAAFVAESFEQWRSRVASSFSSSCFQRRRFSSGVARIRRLRPVEGLGSRSSPAR
jgi:PAS domain S-box-containing protein